MDNLKDAIIHYKQRLEKETKEEKVLRSLQKLKSYPITIELLQVTGIGKTVSGLRKWNGTVGIEARKLVTEWKQVVNGSLAGSSSSASGSKRIKEEVVEEEEERGLGREDGHGRLAHQNERNGICTDRHHESKKTNQSKGTVVKQEMRYSPPSSPNADQIQPPIYIPTKKIKTETKPKRKLLDAGGDGFNASMASFEDCLGFNDVKPRLLPSLPSSSSSSSSSSSKAKKSSKGLDRPSRSTPSNSSDTKSGHSASDFTKNIVSSKVKVEVKVEPKQETYSPTNTPHLMDVAPPLPLIKKPVMNDVDILSNLPEIQTDYKPLRFFAAPDSPPTSRKRAYDMDSTTFMSSRHTRTQVFSGRKHCQYLTEVPSLVNSCVKVLQDNVAVLYDLMYAPYHLIKPVLLRCSPERLQFLEDNNQHLLDETDELWQALCQKQFKGVEPDEFESWRELHYRLAVARDNKLKSITANISRSLAKAVPVRQTKMAFLDCAVKPPRNVVKQQAKFGTASKLISASKLVSPKEKILKPLHSAASTTAKGNSGSSRSSSSAAPSGDPSPSSSGQQQKAVKKVAPLMQKTLKFMKNRFRR